MPDIDTYPEGYAVTWVEHHSDTRTYKVCIRAIYENADQAKNNKFVGDRKVIFENELSPSQLDLTGTWTEGYMVTWMYCESEQYCVSSSNSIYA